MVSGESDSESESSANDKSLAEVTVAVDLIATTFRELLEAVGVNLLTLQDQITEVVEYARNYLSIEMEDYHRVWYKLHVCPDSNRWANVLVLCEKCFSLPFSNGTIERVFSALKLIKTDRRTRLHSDTLSDLLEIQVEGASLSRIFRPPKECKPGGRTVKVHEDPIKALESIMLQEHLLKIAKVPLQQIRGQKVSCSLNGIPGSVEIMRVKPVTESRTSEVPTVTHLVT